MPKVIANNYKYYQKLWLHCQRNNFYYQSIDSNVKRYEEIRKLTTGKGEDFNTERLLDYKYI